VSHDLRNFQFQVRRVEHLGSDRVLYGSLERDGRPHEVTIIARLPQNVSVSVQEGGVYDFAVRAQDVKFFDKKTGLRIDKGPF